MVADAPAQPALVYDGRWSSGGGTWGSWPVLLAAKRAAGLRTAEQARITSAEAERIQNAADRLGKPIHGVGSRAKGTVG